jgi:signal transduction histidine kinase
MVSSYLQLFERRCRTPLEPEARDCLGQARAGAERMRELLEGLLAYSRLDARSSLGRADCGLALRSALDNLRIAILDEGAAIETRGDLPVVRGDEHQLAQLFQNLIGNALKFHRPGVPPRIEIEAETRDGAWLFAVRDDGIGIDPRAAERVFLMFQRLHHREEYAGTGVGLAISKKIVERHGGRIWVEPRAGPGCSFLFTLPATWPAT